MNNPKIKKRKVNKTNLWVVIVSSIAALALVCIVVGIIVLATMLKDKPTLNLTDFEQTESSVIFDSKGDEIASLGSVIRQNVEYGELPNCLVDAFVSIEDSRFFEHNGFDLPRFTKAFIDNILTMSITSGGSTFTMQLVKNTYFTNDETGEQAARSGMSGIKRKVQEIALALELEKHEAKQFIFESYLNKLNFGADRNIRGIQKAAQFYFSKDVSELNLNEAAFLAGVINGPYLYSPFTQDSDGTYHISQAQEREEAVLYQMYNHGYLNKEEYELAKSVQIKDLFTDPYSNENSGDGIQYQAYIDTVVNEVIELTGLDPYTTTMHIYTNMDKNIQNVMDGIEAETIGDYLKFPDEYMECASVCIENSTGRVVAVLGGRNYANGGQLLLNHATEQYKQPGSSIKPILDYALAFENLGWATDHVLTDKPMWLDSSHQNLVYNFSNTYTGDVTLRQAVGNSLNTCAVQTLQSVIDKIKYENVIKYTQSLGYNFTLDDFNVQYAIGGSTCEVTPYQHAAAYAAIMNGGMYTKPHTIERIEFTNGKSPITPLYEPTQVISEQAAYLTTDLMCSNVEYYGGSYDYVKNDDYTVYAKTGTTDWGTAGKDFGIPNGANKDAWLVAATSEYTTATWIGYEKAVLGQQSYITDDCYYNIRPQARIARLILDACYEHGKTKPTKISRPNGISSITHIIGTWPYASASIEGVDLDPSLISTGLIKTDSVKIVNLTPPTIEANPEGSSATLTDETTENAKINLKWTAYPDPSAFQTISDVKDISLRSSSGDVIVSATGKALFDYSWVYGPIRYKADVKVTTNGQTKTYNVSSENNESSVDIGDIRNGSTITVDLYYQYDRATIASNKVTATFNNDMQSKTLVITSATSKEDVKNWCNNNNVEFISEVSDGIHLANTYIIRGSNGQVYSSGTTYEIPLSVKLTCTYYSAPQPTVRITSNGSNSYTYNLSNATANSIKWKCESGCSIDNDTSNTVTLTFDAGTTSTKLSITVTTSDGDEIKDSLIVEKQ